MDETNTTGTLEAETTNLADFLGTLGSEPLNEESFKRISQEVFERDGGVEDLRSLVNDWDAVDKAVNKSTSGVLRGYSQLLVGEAADAEDSLAEQKSTEWGAHHYARALLGRRAYDEAVKVLDSATKKHADAVHLKYLSVEAYSRVHREDEAAKLLEELVSAGQTAVYHFYSGIFEECRGEYAAALAKYREAIAADENFAEAYFRLGNLLELHGTDADDANDEALGAYEMCAKATPIHLNAVMNLGSLFEDRELYHDAIKCYESVLRCHPNHARARLFLADARACTRMFYDREQEKKADRHLQVLKIPVTDFELSVRSRNCLQKMNIKTLGDLIMKTEQELLSYKNFGETSLEEIKKMLSQKGLRLGQGLEDTSRETPAARNPLEASASPEILGRAIEELQLSVRSRRCMERLGVRTVRDLINKTEVELMSAKNFGMTSLNEIKIKLSELNLSLRG